MAGIADDLNDIKGDVADLRGNNQVARFAYTQTAYTNDEAAGTASFDIDQNNNIPTNDAATLNVNPTILDRGYQTQASSLTRQLQNHFFGRVSYNLNKIVDRVWEALGTLSAAMGRSDSAAGDKTYIATLDASGRLPSNQLTEDAMEIKAYWDASTNTPDLTAVANKQPGNVYYVSTEGTRDIGGGSKTYYIGDVLICNKSSQWERIPVTYVKGGAENASAYRTGKVDVTLTSLGISDVKNYDQSKALNGITATQNAASTALSLSRLDGSTAASATINAMTGATSSAAGKAGLVKQPAAGDNTKFLRGDATWAVPTNTTYSDMTGATSSAAGTHGLVPAPAAGKQASFLRGDGTWVVPTNTTYSVFVKSGSTAAAGLVPAPSTTAGTTKYLCEDATWKTIPTATSSVLGGVKIGSNISVSSGTISVADATTSAKGVVKVGTGLAASSGTLRVTNNAIAAEFSTSTNYAVGQVVTYQGLLYRCTTAHTAGAWNSSHFTNNTLLGGAILANANSAGPVPALKSSSQSSYFLRGDNTWQLLSGATVGFAELAGSLGANSGTFGASASSVDFAYDNVERGTSYQAIHVKSMSLTWFGGLQLLGLSLINSSSISSHSNEWTVAITMPFSNYFFPLSNPIMRGAPSGLYVASGFWDSIYSVPKALKWEGTTLTMTFQSHSSSIPAKNTPYAMYCFGSRFQSGATA